MGSRKSVNEKSKRTHCFFFALLLHYSYSPPFAFFQGLSFSLSLTQQVWFSISFSSVFRSHRFDFFIAFSFQIWISKCSSLVFVSCKFGYSLRCFGISDCVIEFGAVIFLLLIFFCWNSYIWRLWWAFVFVCGCCWGFWSFELEQCELCDSTWMEKY